MHERKKKSQCFDHSNLPGVSFSPFFLVPPSECLVFPMQGCQVKGHSPTLETDVYSGIIDGIMEGMEYLHFAPPYTSLVILS